MKKNVVQAKDAPRPIGPYSQAIRVKRRSHGFPVGPDWPGSFHNANGGRSRGANPAGFFKS